MSIRDEFLANEFRRLDKAVGDAYRTAQESADGAFREFVEKHPDELKRRQRAVLDAISNSDDELDEDETAELYDVFDGSEWDETVDVIAEYYTEADQECVDYVNRRAPEVYGESRNMTNYESDMHYHRDLGVGLFTGEMAVGVSKKTLNTQKAFIWNKRNVQSAFTRYLYKAKTVWTVGSRALKSLTGHSRKSTGSSMQRYLWGVSDEAEWDHMMQLKERGIDVEKQWRSTLDGHTRDTHRDLDGQVRPIDEYFDVGKYSIMFTREPGAAPEMIINCRCKTVYLFPKYRDLEENHERVENIRPTLPNGKLGERRRIPNMTYREWEKWKEEHPNG